MTKKIGIIGIRGLPAKYGAFDQHVSMLVNYANDNKLNYLFFIACENKFKKINFHLSNVVRVFSSRLSGFGVIVFFLLSFFKMYCRGVRHFYFFGYGISFLFFFFKIIGCKIICNVDGIEWKRTSNSKIKNFYFKICEFFAAKSNITLIFDSLEIEKYYKQRYSAKGHTIFYASSFLNLITTGKEKFMQNKFKNYIFCVQRLLRENSIDLIVKAFNFSNQSKYKLIIAGPENFYFNRLKIDYINNCKNIIYLGPIYNRYELFNLFKNASFYIHGHQVGGTNPSLIEACSVGRPIISYNSIFNKLILEKKAIYFSNENELSKIFSNLDVLEIPRPPILSSDFEISNIAKQYFELLD